MRNSRNLHGVILLALLTCAVALPGCGDDEKAKALEEAENARISQNKAEVRLARAEKQIAELQALLEAVTAKRDEFAAQVRTLLEDQGKVVATAQQAQEGIKNLTARSSEQTENLTALHSQINELTQIIQSQEKTIAEQEATIQELLQTVETEQPVQDHNGAGEGVQDVNDANDVRLG